MRSSWIHRWRHSLGIRMLTGNMVVVAITVCTLSTLFLWTYNRDLERQLTRRGEAMAGFLADQSQFALLVGDRAGLERLADIVVSNDQVEFVELHDDAQKANPVVRWRVGAQEPREP